MNTPTIVAIGAALDVATNSGVRLKGLGEYRGGDSDSTAAFRVAEHLERSATDVGGDGTEGASAEIGSVDRRTWSLTVNAMNVAIDGDGYETYTLPDSGVTFTLTEDGRGGRSWTFPAAP